MDKSVANAFYGLGCTFWTVSSCFTGVGLLIDCYDVYVIVPITYSQAVLGDSITVPSIDGTVERSPCAFRNSLLSECPRTSSGRRAGSC